MVGHHAQQNDQNSQEFWSFESVYTKYYSEIYRYILVIITNWQEAEDLTQEVFLRALIALPQKDASLKISRWLYRIAKNIVIDTLRRRKLICWNSWDALVVEQESSEHISPQAQAHDIMLQSDPQGVYNGLSETVCLALERMAPLQRLGLLLYQVQGASYEEVIQQTGTSAGGVRMFLVRARKQFRFHYEHVLRETQE